MLSKDDALRYHDSWPPGKISVIPTKRCATADDLSLAYTPGVAHPVLEIEADNNEAYRYTDKGNLVAVISNGTAILGLGDRGALASKPVMEGKGVLFKRFADIDVFDIEIDTRDPDELIRTVKLLEPTFGGINLEDIKAPECFYIEKKLKNEMNIPVFHDDQHGTAIISAAGLINALEITGKKIEDIKVVFNGAGAAGISCARLFCSVGLGKEQIIMCDSKGVIHNEREVSAEKREFSIKTGIRTLGEAVKGADVFVGVSVKDCLTPEMLKSMAGRAIIFAMANPDPEIAWETAVQTRSDIIMASGRSDYPNQVNNVLGFPFIFRGALDVRATDITESMKKAAAYALAKLAREEIPDEVRRAYGRSFSFGPEYIVPKPFDPRVIEWVASAVAKAAVTEGIARNIIADWEQYRTGLAERMKKFWI